tara:strand:- start:1042 stop:1221 length:180 start_codon:yes stop_codon:yes gene_type:complete
MHLKTINRTKDGIKYHEKRQKTRKNTDQRYYNKRFLIRKYEIRKVENADYHNKNKFGDK